MKIDSRWSRWNLQASATLFMIWYAVGFLLLGTSWLPQELTESSKIWGDIVFLLLAASVTFFYSIKLCGTKVATRITVIVLLASACAEMLGAATGFPFGHYKYTENLGPQLFGQMPLIIPFCWLTIILNSLWITLYLLKTTTFDSSSKFFLMITTAFLAVLTDLNLEPVASLVKHYWIWVEPGVHYYGIPGFNFFGWFMVSLIMLAIFLPSLPEDFRVPTTPWPAYGLLASINLLFALINYHAGLLTPVFITLNAFGGLGILLYLKEQGMKK